MVTEVVVDSSVIVALVTLEKHSGWASNEMQEKDYYHILDFSFYEVANAIKYKVPTNLTAKDAKMAFKQAEKLMNLYSVHSFSEVIADALDKALDLEITIYDAALLSLSSKLDIQLVTLDAKMAKKLERSKYDDLIVYPK